MTPQEILQVEKDIVLTLKNVYDPEIPVNIYDLGLIYEIDFDPSGEATIRMTLTAPNCPMADMLVEDVNTQVGKVKGVEKVNVILVFEPALRVVVIETVLQGSLIARQRKYGFLFPQPVNAKM